jgi:3-deoxy-D-manno-octulosonic-acid transferase
MMIAAGEAGGGGRAARVLLGIYRYLPLFIYFMLWAGYYLVPFLRPVLRQRIGMGRAPEGKGPVVWFHGSSVGEVSSIGPVVTEIKRRVPGARILVTTMTVAGRKRAALELEGVDTLVVPLDFFPAVRRFVSALGPSLLIVGETEIWPNLIVETHRSGASIVLVNGRISRRSFPRYRMIRPLVEHLLSKFDLLLMRTDTDAERLINLGGRVDRVRVAGNTKVDILPRPLSAESRAGVRRKLGIDPTRLVISLGSARSGESEIVLDAVRSAFDVPRPLVIIAPRHLTLVSQIEEMCGAHGCSFATVSKESPERQAATDTDVLIIGQMGRLIEVYAISDISIVGGTFRPLGGHNPLEPASQGSVTIVGPHIHNIADDIEYLASGGAARVTDQAGLGSLLRDLAADDEKRRQIAQRAVEVVRSRKGIAGECVDLMAERGLLP